MEFKSVSAKLYLDTRRKLKGTRKHPCTIRLTWLRKQYMTGLNIYCTKEEYSKALSDKGAISPKVKELRDRLLEKRAKAEMVLEGMKAFSWDTFVKLFQSSADISTTANRLDLKQQFQVHISHLKADEKFKSAEYYDCACNSLLSYKQNIVLQDIDKEWLKGYERWMVKKGNTRSTVGCYLRALRTVYNAAIKRGDINNKHYPFKEYTIPRAIRSKSALYPQQVQAFFNYNPPTEAGKKAKAFFFFSYLMNGMNTSDILRLRYKNIVGDKLIFERQKTIDTSSEVKPIVCYLHDYVRDIIKQYGNPLTQNSYIFPVLNNLSKEEEIHAAIKYFKRQTNRVLNRMKKHLGFEGELNLGVARHSFSTKLKIDKVPTSHISDMLGHSSISVTEHYMGSIPSDMVKDISKGLLDFEKNRLKAV